MAEPKTTVWALEAHTRAKHAILARYLQAWQAILGRGGFPDVLYIDGFAGPGQYSKGEDGSPIIALKNAMAARAKQPKFPRLTMLFVEKEQERANVLTNLVAALNPSSPIDVLIDGGKTFEEAFFEFLAVRNGRLPPTFAFIDPFGWSGVPFSIVQRILAFQSCEVLVNFMYEEINRFIGHPDQARNFDSFFGTDSWRAIVTIIDPKLRNRALHDLYAQQLRTAANSRYVRSFQMKNERDVTDYYLFHATKSRKGLEKMKEAMWRVDQSGEFTFSDATDPNQLVLFERRPDLGLLRKQLVERFHGKETTVGDVEEFVLAETAFRETHFKGILKALETSDPAGLVVLNPPSRRARGTYADSSLRIRFL